MEIIFEDCVLSPVSDDSELFDLRFYKKVKKRETGKFEKELGSPLYGLTISTVINKIASYRKNQKYKESVVELKQYLKELVEERRKLRNYFMETPPEKFDTGE